MGILYVLRLSTDFDDLPLPLVESNWASKIKNDLIEQGTNYYIRTFLSVDSFQTWMNQNRLADNELISVLNEWKAIDGNSISENYFELPSYTPGISGLIS